MSNKGNAGSQLDLQIAVNTDDGKALNNAILSLNRQWKGGSIKWFSPVYSSVKKLSYKEFSDKSFLEGRFDSKSESFWDELGGSPKCKVTDWPDGGPRWDGIAVLTRKNKKKTLLLIEAKAHKSELKGSPCMAEAASKENIRCLIDDVKKKHQDVFKQDANWLDTPYYQFSNRLAFLLYLQEENFDVALIYILFANDPYWENRDKTTIIKWIDAQREKYNNFCACEKAQAALSRLGVYELIVDLDSSFGKVKERIEDEVKKLVAE